MKGILMETTALSCKRREGRGKEAARKIRAAGGIPAVVYGHGYDTPISVIVDPKQLTKALKNPKGTNAIFDITIDDQASGKVLVRELQRHAVSRKILHLDLVAPKPGRKLTYNVPVRFTGKSIGVVTGGRLRKPYREVRLEALPESVPAEVVIDITELDHDDTIMASQMVLPEGVRAIYDRDYVVVKVQKPRGRLESASTPEE